MTPLNILKKYYGYDGFRPGQEQLIHAILSGKDALGIMPTGGGKSICYQVPALLLEGVTIVISPLISLMKDQVDTLKEYGIKAELINSTLSNAEFREIIANARVGEYKILYVAPERLETDSFLELIKEIPIAMVAVDEAHCVSQWGHDFRPSYRRIHQILAYLPQRPIVAAFTATATPQVKEDIIKLLELDDPFGLMGSFDRPNLYFEVRKPNNKLKEVEAYLKEHTGESGIIYCSTRKNVDELWDRLNRLGLGCTRYHAGLTETERSLNQEAFLYDESPLIIATNAFGMGIDKPNVRFVLHYNMPKNMESYYQEAGRAGRDGEVSECILLFSTQDIMTNRFLIENGSWMSRSIEYEKLNSMVDYCNTEGCLRSYILTYFGQEALEEGCHNCGSCNNDATQSDITIEAQKIMSCVKRMKERFGSSQVADVLKGANTQRIRSLRFHELSTYGVMSDYPKDTIKELISFLIAEGYLEMAGTEYPVLKLNETSYQVLRGEKQVFIKRIILKETTTDRKKQLDINIDHELFEQLRKLRQRIANKKKVQPFMVFPDTTLKEMSKHYPITPEEMLQVSGVGEYKLEKYGHYFIEVIQLYVEENHLLLEEVRRVSTTQDEGPELTFCSLSDSINQPPSASKYSKRDSHKETYKLYKEGATLSEIAKMRNLSEVTIENHLIRCFEEGMEVKCSAFIPEMYEEQIAVAIERLGTELLKPIKETLPEEVSYTAIKFAICRYKAEKNERE